MIDDPAPESRRQFLARVAKASAAAALTGGAAGGRWKHPGGDDGEDGRSRPTPEAASLPDFRLADAGPRLSIVRGTDRRRMVERSVAALGGMERFVRPGDRVVVKVNAGFARPPEVGAAAHPDAVEAVVRMCVVAGAAEVRVTDFPVNDPEESFRITGIGEATERAGGRIVLPRPDQFRAATLPGGELIVDWPMLLGPFDGATKVIGLAPVKDHSLCGGTVSVKNWYGLVGGRRNLFHQRIQDFLVELALFARPTLVIADGTRALVRNGPTGGSPSDLEDTATVAAGTDPLAVDAFALTLLGRDWRDAPWMARAAAAGAGDPDWERADPAQEQVG